MREWFDGGLTAVFWFGSRSLPAEMTYGSKSYISVVVRLFAPQANPRRRMSHPSRWCDQQRNRPGRRRRRKRTSRSRRLAKDASFCFSGPSRTMRLLLLFCLWAGELPSPAAIFSTSQVSGLMDIQRRLCPRSSLSSAFKRSNGDAGWGKTAACVRFFGTSSRRGFLYCTPPTGASVIQVAPAQHRPPVQHVRICVVLDVSQQNRSALSSLVTPYTTASRRKEEDGGRERVCLRFRPEREEGAGGWQDGRREIRCCFGKPVRSLDLKFFVSLFLL